MARAIPQNREIQFNIGELFFSTTDPKGIIQTGNDVFVRVSGHSKDTLVGSPHNIIRHPDMPKTVFKLLWETIQAGKPISAYVKNMAADGAYYWVLATVFPIEGGYLSIRLKPSTALFDKIPSVYQKMLEKEKKEGVDGSRALLIDILQKEGFPSYESFMTEAIMQEIFSRAKVIAESQKESLMRRGEAHGQLTAISDRCIMSAQQTAYVFSKLEHFGDMNRILAEKSAFILKSMQALDLLAVNMSTAARRLGSAGTTLVAVSAAIQNAANEFKGDLTKFNDSTKGLQGAIMAAQFLIATSRLQVDMIDFYIKEELVKLGNGSSDGNGDLKQNSGLLLDLVSKSFQTLMTEMPELKEQLRKIAVDVEGLRATINGLEIIRKTGGIEAAHIPEGANEFDAPFQAMQRLVRDNGSHLNAFTDAIQQAVRDIDEILPSLRKISGWIGEVEGMQAGL